MAKETPLSTGREDHPPIDWRGWLALAWATSFGVLYAMMVLQERAPHLARTIGRLSGH